MHAESPTLEVEQQLRCSFCDRGRDETGRLIQKRADFAVCRACVEWFLDIYRRREAGDTEAIERPR